MLLLLINVLCYIPVGPRSLDVFLKLIQCRLFMGVVLMIFVWWANFVRGPGEESAFPIYFYVIFLLVLAVYQVL